MKLKNCFSVAIYVLIHLLIFYLLYIIVINIAKTYTRRNNMQVQGIEPFMSNNNQRCYTVCKPINTYAEPYIEPFTCSGSQFYCKQINNQSQCAASGCTWDGASAPSPSAPSPSGPSPSAPSTSGPSPSGPSPSGPSPSLPGGNVIGWYKGAPTAAGKSETGPSGAGYCFHFFGYSDPQLQLKAAGQPVSGKSNYLVLGGAGGSAPNPNDPGKDPGWWSSKVLDKLTSSFFGTLTRAKSSTSERILSSLFTSIKIIFIVLLSFSGLFICFFTELAKPPITVSGLRIS